MHPTMPRLTQILSELRGLAMPIDGEAAYVLPSPRWTRRALEMLAVRLASTLGLLCCSV